MLRRYVVVDRRRHDDVAIQHLRVSIGLGSVCRVVPRCVVPGFSQIRPRLGRRLGKRCGMMGAFPYRLVIVRGRLTRLRRRLAVLVVVIRGFVVGAVRRNARLFVLVPFPAREIRKKSEYILTQIR